MEDSNKDNLIARYNFSPHYLKILYLVWYNLTLKIEK